MRIVAIQLYDDHVRTVHAFYICSHNIIHILFIEISFQNQNTVKHIQKIQFFQINYNEYIIHSSNFVSDSFSLPQFPQF